MNPSHYYSNKLCECGRPATVKDGVGQRMICERCRRIDKDRWGTFIRRKGRPRKQVDDDTGELSEGSVMRKYYQPHAFHDPS